MKKKSHIPPSEKKLPFEEGKPLPPRRTPKRTSPWDFLGLKELPEGASVFWEVDLSDPKKDIGITTALTAHISRIRHRIRPESDFIWRRVTEGKKEGIRIWCEYREFDPRKKNNKRRL